MSLDTYKLAVVGSRFFPDEGKMVKEYMSLLSLVQGKTFTILTGGAPGVDTWAEDEAKRLGISVQLFLPSDKEYEHMPGAMRPLARNGAIVAACDSLVAFWSMDVHINRERGIEGVDAGSVTVSGSGTVHVMKTALMATKLLKIITPWDILRPEVPF